MDTSYVRVDFGGTGNRPARGPLPVWAVRYLLSMDNRMKAVTLNMAEIFSGAPSHYREYDDARSFKGHIISINDRPGLYLSKNYKSDSADALPDPIGDTDTVWSVDRAHQGAYAYIPYMVTGEKYYLDELYFWAGYDLAYGNQGYRGRELGLISDQVRGEAWAIRSIAQAAALAPDTDMEKAYFEDKIANNINAWAAEQDRYPLNHWGQVSTLAYEGGKPWSGATENVSATASAWQEDYVLLSLTHLKELGYDTQSIIDWFSEFHINRFTHPDFNRYNGADYRLPVEENNNRYFATWGEVRDAFVNQPTSFPTPAACNYRRVALAALSCITDIIIEQKWADGTTAQATGLQAYSWLKKELGNAGVYEEDPRWAIVPRQPVGEVALQALISAGAVSVEAGQPVQFIDASHGSPTSWSWDFGDNQTSGERHPQHTYQDVGTYTVSLTVNDGSGSDTQTRTNFITVTEPGSIGSAGNSSSEGSGSGDSNGSGSSGCFIESIEGNR